MLAIRTSLLIPGADEAAVEAAATATADAVTFDLASPDGHGTRGAGRAAVAHHAPLLTRAGRPVHVRLSDARSGELEADAQATVSEAVAAAVLSGTERPQDARDADIAIRRQEMRLGIVPGTVRLIPELDSAAGLRALPAILEAVDRHDAVALNVDALAADLHLAGRAEVVIDHAMADVAIAARAAALPWVLAAPAAEPGERARLANRAHDFGAAGVVIAFASEAAGLNSLFTPSAEEVASARALLAEWERLRAAQQAVGTIGAGAAARLVDRRSARRARLLVALADAIEVRERTR